MMTFRDMINECCLRYGLNRTTSVNAPIDLNTLSLKSLMNAELRELVRCNDWTSLQTKFFVNKKQDIIAPAGFLPDSNIVILDGVYPDIIANSFLVYGEGIPAYARVVGVEIVGNITNLTIDRLTTQVIFVNGTVTLKQDTFKLPDDFNRFIDRTFFVGNRQWMMGDPLSPQEAAFLENYNITAVGFPSFRQIGKIPYAFRLYNEDYLNPVSFYYISDWPVLDADGITYKDKLEQDGDTSVFYPELLIKGALWRFKQQQEQVFDTDLADYYRDRNREISNDGASKTLTVGRVLGYNTHMRHYPITYP